MDKIDRSGLIGFWIYRKELFKIGEDEFIPCIEIKTATKSKGRYILWTINGRHGYRKRDLNFITPEKAMELNAEFQALKLTPADSTLPPEKTCLTAGGTKPKVKFKTEGKVLSHLFSFKKSHPDKAESLVGYKCPNCEFYHIGKTE